LTGVLRISTLKGERNFLFFIERNDFFDN